MINYNEVPFLYNLQNFVVNDAVNQVGEYKSNVRFGEKKEIKKLALLRYNSHIKFVL